MDTATNTTGSNRCLNCTTLLGENDRYCPYCGQKRRGPHDSSVWHLAIDAVGDFFHLESKFFITIIPMLVRPGFLTNEYLAGRQVRYFHPFKLFLFLSFIYFVAAGLISHNTKEKPDNQPAVEEASPAGEGETSSRGNYRLNLDNVYSTGLPASNDSLRNMVKAVGLYAFVNDRYPNANAFEKFMIRKVIKNRIEHNGYIDESLSKTFPKLVFVLIPVFALVLHLLFRRGRRPYVHHVVFTLHFLSLYFLLFSLKDLLSLLTPIVKPLVVLYLLIYLFMALKIVYQRGYLATLFRFVLFLTGSVVVLVFFFVLASAISFMMI